MLNEASNDVSNNKAVKCYFLTQGNPTIIGISLF